MLTVRSSLMNALREFARARTGNVAVIFALASLPLIGFVGAAVDFSHANSVKVAMQAALDSTALMLSKDAANLSDDQLDEKALEYFTALFTRPEGTNIKIDATYTFQGGSQIVVDGKADVPTNFMSALGIDTLTVGGSSTARWGTSRMRVALALDVTLSMASDGKMAALKSATKSLLTQLESAATNNGDVHVSIIPFNKVVNVGASNYTAGWLDWTDFRVCSGIEFNGNCLLGSWTVPSHSVWTGCVSDRGPSSAPGSSTWDQVVTLPNGTAESKWPAVQYSGCPAKMMGLSYNWAAMRSLVDAMSPAGYTNQPIGLVWAWQSLVGGGPLTAPPKDTNYEYKEYIILLSDGMNTENRWFTSQTPVDNRMYQTGNGSGTCANIKAAGITIYAIQVNTGGDPLSTVMRNCASSVDKFYLLTEASQIAGAFDAIGSEMTKLRVAR